MLTKRIIPCLDIKDGKTVKGKEFINLRYAGEPIELAREYVKQMADELVFLDITATLENRPTLISLVEKIAREINIPFSVGGGIRSVKEVADLLRAGADKITVNSAGLRQPSLIWQLSAEFGSQCIVVAIDARRNTHDEWFVHIDSGKTATEWRVVDWAQEAQERGAGEILLTSMNHDGTKSGFAIDLTREISDRLSIPVIASGGAGNKQHFVDVFDKGHADAALAAGIFHFKEMGITELKEYLRQEGIPVRL